MIVRSFDALGSAERAVLYERLITWSSPAPFAGLKAMTHAFTTGAYARGRDLLTLWRASSDPVGVLGMITCELPIRQEVFLVPLFLEEPAPEAALARLLRAARERLDTEAGPPPDTVVRLGVRAPQRRLCGVVEQAGLRPCYAAVEMGRPAGDRRPVHEDTTGASPALAFHPVTSSRVADYVAVHNAAIRLAPNGSATDAEEIRGLVSEVADPEWLQVGYVGSVPAAIVGVTVEDGLGEIAVIAVEPRFQGRGFGEASLNRAMDVVRRHGATEMQLDVVDANRPAFSLYEKHGFTHRRTLSWWFMTTLSSLPAGAP